MDVLLPWLNYFLSILFSFVAIMNGIASLISFIESSLLVYKNDIVFAVLTLYLATLLNSFVNYKIFLIDYLGFYMYEIMSSKDRYPFFNKSDFKPFFQKQNPSTLPDDISLYVQ